MCEIHFYEWLKWKAQEKQRDRSEANTILFKATYRTKLILSLLFSSFISYRKSLNHVFPQTFQYFIEIAIITRYVWQLIKKKKTNQKNNLDSCIGLAQYMCLGQSMQANRQLKWNVNTTRKKSFWTPRVYKKVKINSILYMILKILSLHWLLFVLWTTDLNKILLSAHNTI